MGSDTESRYPDNSDLFGLPEVGPETSSLPVPPSKRPPEDFGDYQFIEQLGKGAFGVVFKVWSLSKCRFEAMKIVDVKALPGSEPLQDFKREVQRMAGVPGAQVAHVYHVGALPDGRPFFTMEYLSGGRLDHYCARRLLSIEDRIRMMAEICDGVHKLHELDLVHCDLKPGNILVTEDAETAVPKLVDFGLASHQGFRQSPTRTALGTLPYMAPEQLESTSGRPKRHWDIYALGVTLYQLLVGECPLDLSAAPLHSLELLAAHVRKTPVPPLLEKLTSITKAQSDELARERRLTVDTLRRRLGDPWLEAVIDKALAKEPDKRFKSAAEMARNLRSCASRRRPDIVPPTPRDRVVEFVRDHRWAVAISTVLGVSAVLFLWGYGARTTAKQAQVTLLFRQGLTEVDPSQAIKAFQQALQSDPARSDIRLHLAGAFVARGDADQAMNAVRAIPASDRYFTHAQAFIRGVDQFRAARHDESAEEAARLAVVPGEEYYYSLTLGPDQAEHAVWLLTQALKTTARAHEERFHIRLLRAMRYFQLGDFESLDSESRWLVDTVPDSAAAWNLRGLACWKAGRQADAVSAFDTALRINPEYAAVYRNRADLNNKLKRYASALKDCERALKLQPSLAPSVQGVRVEALLGNGDFTAAQAECERGRDSGEFTLQTHIACGNLWTKVQLPERAWEEFDLAVKLADSQVPGREELAYLAIWNRGDAASTSKRYADAIRDFDRAEELRPEQWARAPENFHIRGLTYLLADQPSKAVVDLEKAAQMLTRVSKGNAEVYLWIWDIRRSEGKVPEAEEALRLAKEAATKDKRLARIVAHCMDEIGREPVLEDAADDPKKRIVAYYYLGLAAKARRDREEALRCFQECLGLKSHGNDKSEDYLADLAEMQLSRLNAEKD